MASSPDSRTRDLRRSCDGNAVTLVREGCAQLFLLYTGRAGFPGTPLMRLVREIGLGNRNFTLLRDPHHNSFLSGAHAEASDLDAFADWHADHLEGLSHVRSHYCIGNSAGGIAAMLFGRLLGARHIWAFSPRPATRDSFDQALEQAKEVFAWAEAAGPCEIFYCPDDPVDRQVAEYFAPYEGVQLRARPSPAADHTHRLMANMVRDGELRELLPPFAEAKETADARREAHAQEGAKDW